jgi:two-component system phosphate regulon response regulator PhoB
LRDLPIIFITGRSEIEDKEMAFSMGADDYIVKPMSTRELRARVLGRLRRAQKVGENFTVGNLKFELPLQKVIILNGTLESSLDTTSLEFRILLYFAKHEDHIFSRNQLLTAVWGENVHLLERTVDTHISHLRKKLKEAGSDITIRPIHGSGYKLTTEKNIKKVS